MYFLAFWLLAIVLPRLRTRPTGLERAGESTIEYATTPHHCLMGLQYCLELLALEKRQSTADAAHMTVAAAIGLPQLAFAWYELFCVARTLIRIGGNSHPVTPGG